MTNKFLLSILLIISALLSSCTEKDDAVRAYWSDGKLKSELRYTDGKLDGVCKWYYSNGNPSMEATYTMNVLNGESTRWFENGVLEEKCYYKDNQYDGVVEEYNVFGTLTKKSTYIDGVLNGPFFQYYENGKPFIEGEYLDGMMHGGWIMYYPDGSIGSNAVYDRGTGVQHGFAEGGLYKNALIHYKDNVKHGKEIHYDMHGDVTEILLWDNGKYIGNEYVAK